jgi:hypothetical protein
MSADFTALLMQDNINDQAVYCSGNAVDLYSGNVAKSRRNLHQLLTRKPLHSALYGVYTEVIYDLMAVLKESAAIGETAKTTITIPPSKEEPREHRRRKRTFSDDADERTKKLALSATGVNSPKLRSKNAVPTPNFFAPLRSTEMEADHGDDADNSTERYQEQAPSSQAGRPLPIVLISQANVIQLQRQLMGLLKGSFEFCSTRNETRIVKKEIADCSTTRAHFDSNNLPNFTFYPKSQKPMKAVIRNLPYTTPAEDISDGLVNTGLDVISVKQMSTAVNHL